MISATSIWELGCNRDNPSEFASAMEQSEFNDFGFTEDFIFDLYGAISDAKQGRLKKTTTQATEFPGEF